MTVKQISVFIQNKTGGLATVTDILAKANVNIRALSLAEAQEFGILRLIVDDVFEAGNALKEAGHIYSITDVIAVAGDDKPGSIARIIAALSEKNIDLDYAYAFFAKKENLAYMIVSVRDTAEATKVLRDAGIHVATTEEITSC